MYVIIANIQKCFEIASYYNRPESSITEKYKNLAISSSLTAQKTFKYARRLNQLQTHTRTDNFTLIINQIGINYQISILKH